MTAPRRELSALRRAVRCLEDLLQSTPGGARPALEASGTGDWTVYPADAARVAEDLLQHSHHETLGAVLRATGASEAESEAVDAALRGDRLCLALIDTASRTRGTEYTARAAESAGITVRRERWTP